MQGRARLKWAYLMIAKDFSYIWKHPKYSNIMSYPYSSSELHLDIILKFMLLFLRIWRWIVVRALPLGEDWTTRFWVVKNTLFSFWDSEGIEENWKTTISHTVRNASSRVTHTVYVGLALALSGAFEDTSFSQVAVLSLTHTVHGVRVLWWEIFQCDGMEMHLPSSWTHESVNTKHKLSSDSCSSSDIELRECETTKS